MALTGSTLTGSTAGQRTRIAGTTASVLTGSGGQGLSSDLRFGPLSRSTINPYTLTSTQINPMGSSGFLQSILETISNASVPLMRHQVGEEMLGNRSRILDHLIAQGETDPRRLASMVGLSPIEVWLYMLRNKKV